MVPALSAAMTMPSLIFTETMMVTAAVPPVCRWREDARAPPVARPRPEGGPGKRRVRRGPTPPSGSGTPAGSPAARRLRQEPLPRLRAAADAGGPPRGAGRARPVSDARLLHGKQDDGAGGAAALPVNRLLERQDAVSMDGGRTASTRAGGPGRGPPVPRRASGGTGTPGPAGGWSTGGG